MRVPRLHVGPTIIIREIECYIICRLSLAHHKADPLEILRHVGHDDPPGILFIEDARGIEAPPWIFNTGRRIWPTVSNQLIDALKEMDISFSFYVQWCCSKHRGVQPGPRFG